MAAESTPHGQDAPEDRGSTPRSQDDDAATAQGLEVRGATLDTTEMAAVTAVVQAYAAEQAAAAQAAAAQQEEDRTLERRRRLGLWERPGRDSWRRSAGQD